ncbi:hypothetical protein B0H11DRAFT_2069314 [Mycena galericulata]|nr:hypothetical protein B0H11DRAFT_2069314 [Mycena galericulata]
MTRDDELTRLIALTSLLSVRDASAIYLQLQHAGVRGDLGARKPEGEGRSRNLHCSSVPADSVGRCIFHSQKPRASFSSYYSCEIIVNGRNAMYRPI